MSKKQSQSVSFLPRFFAELIDISLLSLPGLLSMIYVAMAAEMGLSEMISRLLQVIILVQMPMILVLFFYYPFLIYRYGQTVGKMLFGLEVFSADNKKLTFWWALFREQIAKTVSQFFFGLGYVWIIKDPQNMAWHDHLAGTKVRQNSKDVLNGYIALILLLIIHIFLIIWMIAHLRTNPGFIAEFMSYFQ